MALLTVAAEVWLRVTDDRDSAVEDSANRTMRRWAGLLKAGIVESDEDPIRRYALRPGAECTQDGWTFRVSRNRTRGPDVPETKAEGEKRLLCVGDSFAFGLWCNEDETLVAHLVRMANARERENGTDVTWRAVNQGVPGYHIGQQRVAFEEEGLALEPDVVVIYFNTNDIQRFGYFYDEDYGLYTDNLPLPVWLKRRLWSSHLYGFITRKHFRSFSSITTPYLDPRVPWAHVREENQEYTREALGRIVELCRERDVPVFFVNQPQLVWGWEMRDTDWAYLDLVAWAERTREELGLPGIDLLGWMRGYADGEDRIARTPAGKDLPPPEFLLEEYFADEVAQAIIAFAKDRASEAGLVWEDLSGREQRQLFRDFPGEIPEKIDYHLTGAAYERIAELVYPRMRDAGILP